MLIKKSKKKLLIIAGSGATIEYKMPSVSAIHGSFLDICDERFLFQDIPDQNLYKFLYDSLEQHWKDSKPSNYNIKPSFEDVLYLIFSLTSYNPFFVLEKIPTLRNSNKNNNFDHRKTRGALQDLSQFLIDKLLLDIRQKCIDVGNESHREIESFYENLSESYLVSTVTTNYDNILYRSSGNKLTGFIDSNGTFNEGLIIERQEWPCFVHLHGSIHFNMKSIRKNLHEIHWQNELDKKFNGNSSGRNLQFSNEGITFPKSNIIAGYGKTVQNLHHPFRTYYSELDRLVYESDAILFIGYGFADNHLSSAFSNYYDKRNRKVVIIDFADENMTMASGSNSDEHPNILVARKYLPTIFDRSKAPQSIYNYKSEMKFDRSIDNSKRMSVWYNGARRAYERIDLIMKELFN